MGAVADPVVRPERPEDHDAVARVVEAAFGAAAEARLVEAIRASPGYIAELALVAERGGRVVGHVMISLVGLEAAGGSTGTVPSLSPLAVDPREQARGIGSALVREVTAAARRRGDALVVLEGDPRYYGRFGFEPAAARGIRIDLPSWAPPEAAQVLVLQPGATLETGRVVYPPAFDVVTEH